jgi:5'-3' exoribonuclease 1
VGNDFLPHLPDLHIHENGLERLFDVYKKVLPDLGMVDERVSVGTILLTAVFFRQLYQREWNDKHEAATSSAGRDGIMGAGGI